MYQALNSDSHHDRQWQERAEVERLLIEGKNNGTSEDDNVIWLSNETRDSQELSCLSLGYNTCCSKALMVTDIAIICFIDFITK